MRSVPASELGTEVICVTSRWEDFKSHWATLPPHLAPATETRGHEFRVHDRASTSLGLWVMLGGALLPTSAEHDLWMRKTHLMYLSWRSICYHSITYASLLICLNLYIYNLGERCWNFTSINMTVKSGNWMGWLHERLQSESQWKDSGRQQYLKRRKIRGAMKSEKELSDTWNQDSKKFKEREVRSVKCFWDLFQFNSFLFFFFFSF